MKWFTRVFILLFIAVPFCQSCTVQVNGSNDLMGGKTVKGSGTIVNKEISIDDYTYLDLGGVANVIYEQVSEEKPYLQVNVDDNILPLLDVKVEGGRLTIKTKDNKNINPTKFTVYTNSRYLNQVDVSGSGDLRLKGEVNSKNMKIKVSGAGNLETDSLYCENLEAKISGSGDMKIGGASNSSSFSISGAGDVKAFNYLVQDLTCRISGAGDIEASVSGKLDASVSGAGDIKYKGSPQVINKKVSGAGSIRKVD